MNYELYGVAGSILTGLASAYTQKKQIEAQNELDRAIWLRQLEGTQDQLTTLYSRTT